MPVRVVAVFRLSSSRSKNAPTAMCKLASEPYHCADVTHRRKWPSVVQLVGDPIDIRLLLT